MNIYTASVVVVFAGILIFYFTVFRGKGIFRIKTLFGSVEAEGSNDQSIEVSIENARAGRDITAQATASDIVRLKQVEAGRDVRVSKSPPDADKR